MAAPKKDRKKRVRVVSRHGAYDFQTGIVTAELLSRGVPMKRAFPLARQVRDRVNDRGSITTDQLEEQIQAVLDDAGWVPPVPEEADSPSLPRSPLLDRVLLARDFNATPLSAGAISDLLAEVSRQIADGQLDAADDAVLQPLIEQVLLERWGSGPLARYRLARWVRTADRPVVIFIGGATGTGKSTLATDLAFRLGIRLASSTDMIRETMRAVLSPEVTPGLHAHSFRGLLEGGELLSDPRERVLAGFHQQAAQVAVGIRAVVRRAVREGQHLIIEGTHLLPPFQRYLPAGASVYSAGFVMAVPEPAQHLARFPRRARDQRLRDPAPYMDAYQSVRWIHDDLLGLAEDAESIVLASGPIDQTVSAALEYVSQTLAHQAEDRWMDPGGADEAENVVPPKLRTLLIIFDGLSDEPNDALGGLTPLAAATAPTLHRLAGAGGQGLVQTCQPNGEVAHTDTALWGLLGGRQGMPVIGRGLFEAMGRGLALQPGSVVFRGNLATADQDGHVIDRRAGRIREGVTELLAGLRDVRLSGGMRGSITPGHEHRVVVVLSGAGLSERVSDTDPGRADPDPRLGRPRPLDDSPESARTAEALRELLDRAAHHLAASSVSQRRVAQGLPAVNCILTRGAARAGPLRAPHPLAGRMAMVASCTTALGVARALGLQAVTDLRMTGNLDTDIEAKLSTAAALLDEWHAVAVHFKATDVAAHDHDPLAKRDFIQRVDLALGRLLRERAARQLDQAGGLRVVVTGDHGTSSITGDHLAAEVPVLLAPWQEDAEPQAFDEDSAHYGALGILSMRELADLLWLA
ncbi:MAG: hypothetical protein GXP62_20250 [Oligoflexia bacterium]|nr:hypothetical protein [Oligoflexia bacterium]